MSDLNYHEKRKLEDLLGMSGGYVLQFTDRSFGDFFDDFGLAIHSEKYCAKGTSKANKLRTFWAIESNILVGNVLLELIREAEEVSPFAQKKSLKDECRNIANKLRGGEVNFTTLAEVSARFGNDYIQQQIKRMEDALGSDDLELAIGTAKELIETCCKSILNKRGVHLKGQPEMSEITKETFKELKMSREDISDEMQGADSFRRLLSNLASVVNEVSRLRNLYGTGHGKLSGNQSLSKCHAKLIVSSASALVVFLFETSGESIPLLESHPRQPLGRWLVENAPRGTNFEPPSRDDPGRPNTFLEEDA